MPTDTLNMINLSNEDTKDQMEIDKYKRQFNGVYMITIYNLSLLKDLCDCYSLLTKKGLVTSGIIDYYGKLEELATGNFEYWDSSAIFIF